MAIGITTFPHMRRTKLSEDLTAIFATPRAVELEENSFVESPVRKGRRSELSDAQLQNRRSQLVQAFEGLWGEIGCRLGRCKRPEELLEIFSPLDQTYVENLIAPFRRLSSEPPSDAELRRIRSQLHRMARPRYAMAEVKRKAIEQLQSADGALAQATGRSRRQLKSWQKKCRKEATRPFEEYRRLCRSEAHLQDRLIKLEASFARQQLFRFLKSKRYELTPLNLANALAGIPFMGWRQSMRRTSSTKCIIANGQAYQVFKAMRYLVQSAEGKTEKALQDRFRNGIPSLPTRYKAAKKELSDNWFYVQRAIRQAAGAKALPKMLPFEITQRYYKQMQVRSSVDVALAQHHKLVIRPFHENVLHTGETA